MSTVSAIVSAYHAEDFLHQRLTNLKEQTAEVEIVVVCRKTSVEREICAYHGIKPILTDDIPPIGTAWNIAIQNATGDYCCIANTDDTWHPQGIENMAAVLDNDPDIGLVYGDVLYIQNGVKFRNTDRGKLGRGGRVERIAELLGERYFIGNMPMWRRSLHEASGYFNEKYYVACDYDWCLRLAQAEVGFYYLPEIVGTYPLRNGSLERRVPGQCALESRTIRGAR
jgi:GT2 family glycosyltransferase